MICQPDTLYTGFQNRIDYTYSSKPKKHLLTMLLVSFTNYDSSGFVALQEPITTLGFLLVLVSFSFFFFFIFCGGWGFCLYIVLNWNHFWDEAFFFFNLRINFLFIYCGLFPFILVVFCVVSFFHYVSAKFPLAFFRWFFFIPRPRIGMLSLVTVSPVITAFP